MSLKKVAAATKISVKRDVVKKAVAATKNAAKSANLSAMSFALR